MIELMLKSYFFRIQIVVICLFTDKEMQDLLAHKKENVAGGNKYFSIITSII
jgi:hypothetical protein